MRRSARTSLLLALACAACAHAPGASTSGPPGTASGAPQASGPSAAGSPGDAARVAAIRAEVERLLAGQGKLLWEAWTHGAAADLGAGASASAQLFSVDTLSFVRGARDRASGDERRALSLLYGYLVGEHLAGAAPPQRGDRATVAWNGRSVPTARVPELLAAERDPARRATLEHAWVEAERQRAPAVDARWAEIAAAARRAGLSSLPELSVELRGQTISEMSALAEAVLGATDAAYRSLLGALARAELDRSLADLRGRDVPRLLQLPRDRHDFPAGRASADVGATFASMGLDLQHRPGLLLDLEARPGKDPRPLALPVEVPGGVRVSFAPRGGCGELRALLHEMGAAAFYSFVSSPVMEFRRLGAVTAETWASLFEDLGSDPTWLAERTGLPQGRLAPVVRVSMAQRLHRARTLAARILIELGRAGGKRVEPAASRAVLERAFAHPVEADELSLFLFERDPLLESADALRALLLSAQAQAFLAGRSSGAWWLSKDSGAWLASAFSQGSRLSPAELARSFGAAAVDPTALAATARTRAAAAGIQPAAASRSGAARGAASRAVAAAPHRRGPPSGT